MALTKPPVKNPWAEAGDKVEPSGAELSVGWPLSNIPPSRQRFNWILNFLANGVRYLTRRGIADWALDEPYEIGDKTRSLVDGFTYSAKLANTNKEPSANATEWELWAYTDSQLLPRVDSLVSISVAGAGSPVLSFAQYNNGIIILTGILTGNINVIFPNIARKWVVRNQTTGAFTIGLKTAAGVAYTLGQNESQSIYCDAANNIYQSVVASQTIADASSTVKGIVELATDAETNTGTDTVRAITPSNLSARTATETRAGLAEIATVLEAQGFTDDLRFLTSLKLNNAFQGANQSLTTNGYQKLPGGLILQWGLSASVASDGSVIVTLPITFPIACLGAVGTARNTAGTGPDVTSAHVVSFTTSQLTLFLDSQAASRTMPIQWFALGN